MQLSSCQLFDDGQLSKQRRQSNLTVDLFLILVTANFNSVNHFFFVFLSIYTLSHGDTFLQFFITGDSGSQLRRECCDVRVGHCRSTCNSLFCTTAGSVAVSRQLIDPRSKVLSEMRWAEASLKSTSRYYSSTVQVANVHSASMTTSYGPSVFFRSSAPRDSSD